MDEHLAYVLETNQRRSSRLQRIVIILIVLLVVAICVTVTLGVLLLQLKLESLISQSTLQPIQSNRNDKSSRVVFAMNVVSEKDQNRMKRSVSEYRRRTTAVIQSYLVTHNTDGTEFALQLYSVHGNTTLTTFSSVQGTLKLLTTIDHLDFPFDNPNQTDAISQFINEYGHSNGHNLSYVLFAASPSTYRDAMLYEKDMRHSTRMLNEIGAANGHVVVIGDRNVFQEAYIPIINSSHAVDEISAQLRRKLPVPRVSAQTSDKSDDQFSLSTARPHAQTSSIPQPDPRSVLSAAVNEEQHESLNPSSLNIDHVSSTGEHSMEISGVHHTSTKPTMRVDGDDDIQTPSLSNAEIAFTNNGNDPEPTSFTTQPIHIFETHSRNAEPTIREQVTSEKNDEVHSQNNLQTTRLLSVSSVQSDQMPTSQISNAPVDESHSHGSSHKTANITTSTSLDVNGSGNRNSVINWQHSTGHTLEGPSEIRSSVREQSLNPVSTEHQEWSSRESEHEAIRSSIHSLSHRTDSTSDADVTMSTTADADSNSAMLLPPFVTHPTILASAPSQSDYTTVDAEPSLIDSPHSELDSVQMTSTIGLRGRTSQDTSHLNNAENQYTALGDTTTGIHIETTTVDSSTEISDEPKSIERRVDQQTTLSFQPETADIFDEFQTQSVEQDDTSQESLSTVHSSSTAPHDELIKDRITSHMKEISVAATESLEDHSKLQLASTRYSEPVTTQQLKIDHQSKSQLTFANEQHSTGTHQFSSISGDALSDSNGNVAEDPFANFHSTALTHSTLTRKLNKLTSTGVGTNENRMTASKKVPLTKSVRENSRSGKRVVDSPFGSRKETISSDETATIPSPNSDISAYDDHSLDLPSIANTMNHGLLKSTMPTVRDNAEQASGSRDRQYARSSPDSMKYSETDSEPTLNAAEGESSQKARQTEEDGDAAGIVDSQRNVGPANRWTVTGRTTSSSENGYDVTSADDGVTEMSIPEPREYVTKHNRIRVGGEPTDQDFITTTPLDESTTPEPPPHVATFTTPHTSGLTLSTIQNPEVTELLQTSDTNVHLHSQSQSYSNRSKAFPNSSTNHHNQIVFHKTKKQPFFRNSASPSQQKMQLSEGEKNSVKFIQSSVPSTEFIEIPSAGGAHESLVNTIHQSIVVWPGGKRASSKKILKTDSTLVDRLTSTTMQPSTNDPSYLPTNPTRDPEATAHSFVPQSNLMKGSYATSHNEPSSTSFEQRSGEMISVDDSSGETFPLHTESVSNKLPSIKTSQNISHMHLKNETKLASVALLTLGENHVKEASYRQLLNTAPESQSGKPDSKQSIVTNSDNSIEPHSNRQTGDIDPLEASLSAIVEHATLAPVDGMILNFTSTKDVSIHSDESRSEIKRQGIAVQLDISKVTSESDITDENFLRSVSEGTLQTDSASLPRETAIVNERQRANHPQQWNPVTGGSIDIGKGDVIKEEQGVPTPYSPSSYLESSAESTLNAGRTDTDDTGTYSNQMKTGALTTSTSKYIDLRPSKPQRDDKSSSNSNSILSGTIYPCKVDLIIAIDYQPNINANRDQTAKLVARMIKNWTISMNKTRIAIVSYGLDDGVGIYTGGLVSSQAQAQDELLYSLESGGYTFGVIYTLSRLFKQLKQDYSTNPRVDLSVEDPTRDDNRIRDNTRVAFLIFSASRIKQAPCSDQVDIESASKIKLCDPSVFHECKVLSVQLSSGADLSKISQPSSATMQLPRFDSNSLALLSSFVRQNLCI